LNFRIFQDMLGNQKILRLSNANTTELAQALAADDDTVYVKDVSKLSEPNLVANIFGQLIVGGERITYRTRNTSNNSVSGLRRGTAGTSAMAHVSGAVVSDAGPAQQIGSQYQESVSSDTTGRGDNSTVAFVATLTDVPSSLTGSTLNSAIAVSVGGTLMTPTTDYTVVRDSATQVTVTFATAPASGSEIDISITTGKVMYAQGIVITSLYTTNDINWTAVSTGILAVAAGDASSANIGVVATTIADDGFENADFNSSGSITSIDSLYAAQYGAGTLPDGAIKTRLVNVFVPALMTARDADPTLLNQYFNTPTESISISTASNGIALQEQTTAAALFLKDQG